MECNTKQMGWIILCLLLLAPLPVAAKSDSALLNQRANFKAAEQALAKGDLGRYRGLKSSLKDYPLYPYLEYRELRWRLHGQKKDRIKDFITDYADTPLSWLLRNAWLDRLAKRGHWKTYAEFYKPSSKVARQCHYLQS